MFIYLQPTIVMIFYLALIKVDTKNIFNMCNRLSFLSKVPGCLPKISAWTHWYYTQPAELHIGDQHILASAGVPLQFWQCLMNIST